MFWKSVALRQCIHIVQVFIIFKCQMKNSKIAVSEFFWGGRRCCLCGFFFLFVFGVGLIFVCDVCVFWLCVFVGWLWVWVFCLFFFGVFLCMGLVAEVIFLYIFFLCVWLFCCS